MYLCLDWIKCISLHAYKTMLHEHAGTLTHIAMYVPAHTDH